MSNCPRCGNTYFWRNEDNEPVCSQCSYIHHAPIVQPTPQAQYGGECARCGAVCPRSATGYRKYCSRPCEYAAAKARSHSFVATDAQRRFIAGAVVSASTAAFLLRAEHNKVIISDAESVTEA